VFFVRSADGMSSFRYPPFRRSSTQRDPGSRVIFHAYLGRHPYPAFSWTEGHSASIHRAGMFVLKDTRVPGFLGHLTLVLEPTRFSRNPDGFNSWNPAEMFQVSDEARFFDCLFGFGDGCGVIHVEQENTSSYIWQMIGEFNNLVHMRLDRRAPIANAITRDISAL
jgi:hypothetical protein